MIMQVFNTIWMRRFWYIIVFCSVIVGLWWSDSIHIKGRSSFPITSTSPSEDIIHLSLSTTSGELLVSPRTSYQRRKEVIGTSRGSLDFWLYSFTEKKLLQRIQSLATQWVEIRAILEDKLHGDTPRRRTDLKASLTNNNISIQSDSKLHTNFVHAKTFLWESGFIIQTANLTHSSFEKNREYFWISRDNEIHDNLKKIFESDRAWNPVTSDEIHPNLLICPINCRSKIVYLLKSARQSIDIQNQYIKDDQIQQLLLHYAKGVTLRIILPNTPDNRITQSKFPNSVRLLTSPYTHAKMIAIDNDILVLSSINLSSNSIDNNREIGIIINNARAFNQWKKTFDDDRSRAK